MIKQVFLMEYGTLFYEFRRYFGIRPVQVGIFVYSVGDAWAYQSGFV